MAARLLRNALCTAALALAAGSPLMGQETAQPPAGDQAEDVAFRTDWSDRMTVPVSIGGLGPFQFVVDTGAERTIISQELADRLGLSAGRGVTMHSMSEVGSVDTVLIPRLDISRKTVTGLDAPALSRSNLGAEGMLGVDSLQSQRVLFDFENQKMTISPSRRRAEPSPDPDTIVVRARSRFGRLVLTDARVDGEKVWVIIDTGAQVSIGNEALRRKLAHRLRPMTTIEVISVTGGRITADYTTVQGMEIGRLKLKDMPIAFADAAPFKKLDLLDRPALLLGMNPLRAFDRVSIDFANRTVRFEIPDVSGIEPDTRMAALAR